MGAFVSSMLSFSESVDSSLLQLCYLSEYIILCWAAADSTFSAKVYLLETAMGILSWGLTFTLPSSSCSLRLVRTWVLSSPYSYSNYLLSSSSSDSAFPVKNCDMAKPILLMTPTFVDSSSVVICSYFGDDKSIFTGVVC